MIISYGDHEFQALPILEGGMIVEIIKRLNRLQNQPVPQETHINGNLEIKMMLAHSTHCKFSLTVMTEK